MTRILHLSDPHLAPPGVDGEIGDYKERGVPAGQRQRRADLLADSLTALGRRLEAPLDAVVVSGDVTLQGRPDGFDLLPELLERLGPALPTEDRRIVVVPGNHDVVRDTPPSSAARYAPFLKIRTFGYTTPLLDGVDIGDDGSSLAEHDPVLQVSDDATVVALNSANYSHLLEPLDIDIEGPLRSAVADGHLSQDVLDAVARLGRRDVARIASGHLRAVRTRLASPRVDGVLPPLLIAVLHHQLLPVSLTEEYKPYEALSNLGEVRAFLLSGGFDLVLHGHKHVENVIEDVLVDQRSRSAEAPRSRRILVCSCGTVGGGVGHGAEIAKLLTIETVAGRARRLRVESVGGVAGGGDLPEPLPGVVHAVQHARSDTSRLVSGRTTSDVQSRLRQMFDSDPHRRIYDLTCVVEDARDAEMMPAGYPDTDDGSAADMSAWFNTTVDWWQDPTLIVGKPFTHGQRVEAWGAQQTNQLSAAAAVLATDPSSSRAVVVLVDPGRDHVDRPGDRFPSFTSLHFYVEGTSLHATALFRKQEMRFWWAVNVAEISRMRRQVLERLATGGRTYAPGRITTIASQAVASLSRPSVAIPLSDRRAWQPDGPHELWLLASAVFYVETPGRAALISRLRDFVEDWRPPESAGPDGVPVPERGLDLLLQGLQTLQALFGLTASDPRVLLIGDLEKIRAYALAYRGVVNTDARTAFDEWRTAAAPAIEAALRTLAQL